MKVRLTATCLWNVTPEDEEVAKDFPKDIILDYLLDAAHGDPLSELTDLEVSVKEEN